MRKVGGVMIEYLSGNYGSVAAFIGAMNKTITELTLGDDDALHFTFDDGSKIKLFDAMQKCCETRYMRTDDNLADYIGAQLLDAEIKHGPTEAWKDDGAHEVAFLEVRTSKGCFTMSSHNEAHSASNWRIQSITASDHPSMWFHAP